MEKQEIFFKSLGNISRVKILACIGDSEKTVNELIGNCELSQSAVSQHLAYLRRIGLVSVRREGRHQIYTPVDKKLSTVCRDILEIYNNLN